MSFKEAVQKLNTDLIPGDGFCISNKVSIVNIHILFVPSSDCVLIKGVYSFIL